VYSFRSPINSFRRNNSDTDYGDMFYQRKWAVREDNALLLHCKDYTDLHPSKCKQLPIFYNLLRHRPSEHIRNRIKKLARTTEGAFMNSVEFIAHREAMKAWLKDPSKKQKGGFFDFDGFLQAHPRPDYPHD
jgi:hypothetical protein